MTNADANPLSSERLAELIDEIFTEREKTVIFGRLLRPDAKRNANSLMDQAHRIRRLATGMIAEAEKLEQLAYQVTDYAGGGGIE